MCDRGAIQPDTLIFTKSLEISLGKIGAIVSDDTVRVAVSQDNLLQESDSGVSIQLPDWLDFDPFGELIHHDKNVGHVPSGRPEWSDHIQVKGICLRGNNKVVIFLFHVYDKCLFLML